MSNKPDTLDGVANAGSARLAHWSVLEIAGRDAIAFAQAQVTSDVAALTDLHWQWSAWLTPKGRVVALFVLLRVDAERLWLLLPDHDATALQAQLQRFVFRSKARLAVLDVAVVGSRDANDASGTRAARDAQGEVSIALSSAPVRALRIRDTADTIVDEDPSFTAAWRLDDIAQGLPRLSDASVEAFTPQMLGLDRLAAYSLKKGCYPGQEIVSRTHYLGHAKRGLARVLLLAPVEIGARLQGDSGGSADVVCSAQFGDRHEALVVASLEPDTATWRDTAGIDSATPCPLLDGLQH